LAWLGSDVIEMPESAIDSAGIATRHTEARLAERARRAPAFEHHERTYRADHHASDVADAQRCPRNDTQRCL
jgi:hypothetical protein